MDQLSISVFIVFSLLLLIILIYTKSAHKVKEAQLSVKHLQQQHQFIAGELAQERELVQIEKSKNLILERSLATLQSDLRHVQDRYHEAVDNQAQNQEKFEQLANKVITTKTELFDRQHKAGIKEVLEPLKERIKTFEERIERSSKENIEQHSALKSQIFHLKQLNEKITQEAANLTRALKGDNKVQGNWGELILESILDKSGLERDREYFVQQSFIDTHGKRQRPDVVISLPDQKKIIIDSKVSLTAYESLVSADSKEEQDMAAIAHQRSIKQHIDGLAVKNYHDLYQMESPDFVLMFIPIDTAFAVAISNDKDLYGYAFDKNIVVVTPSTLLATLKTVDTIWKNEKQHRYAQEIASEAGKMYDKLALFSEDLLDIGRRIDQTKDAYQESMKKLVHGKGNLIGRAQKVKSLGAKANKSINEGLVKRIEE